MNFLKLICGAYCFFNCLLFCPSFGPKSQWRGHLVALAIQPATTTTIIIIIIIIYLIP
jgi:hypothetical protein